MLPDHITFGGLLVLLASLWAVYGFVRWLDAEPDDEIAENEIPEAEPVHDGHEYGDPGA